MTTQRVLITGAGGFIGSHLVEQCVERGYRVNAFVRYNSQNSWGWLERSIYKSDIEVFAGDVRDLDSVLKAMHGVDLVFHLAALIGIPYSYSSPLSYIRTNIEGTYNVLQAARTLPIKVAVMTSTSEVYGTAMYVPIDEKHPLAAQSPYSATKIAADQLALSFYRSFGLPIKIVRPFNTYGPRQSARAIIPTTITQILSGERELRLGNLHPTRDLTYVKDTANAFIEIAACDRLYGEVTNVGMKEEISMGDLARKIAALAGAEVIFRTDDQRVRPDNSEVERLVCDNSTLVAETLWRPQYDLDSGLRETIAWLKNHLPLYKSDLYNV